MESYTLYTKDNCPACITATELLEVNNMVYDKLLLDKDFSIIELYEVVPRSTRSFPCILKNGVFIGGLKELKQDLEINSG